MCLMHQLLAAPQSIFAHGNINSAVKVTLGALTLATLIAKSS